MSGSRLARLINPENIAVVGGDAAEFTIRSCERFGFKGQIWGVNPNRESMAGHPCFARVEDLPSTPDAVLVVIPAEPTIETVRILSAMGAGGAVCFASGFSEVGDQGGKRQRALVEAAGDMALIGPNCHGFLNYMNGAVLWPDQHGGEHVDRGVAIVSQSGNMGINFTMQRRGLSLAALVSLGNQAVCGVEDCVEAFLEDDRITAIGMHIEGLTDLEKFITVAEHARKCGVPLVALKTGRSAMAAKISLGHTASLAGSDRLYDALFERLGVARVATVEEFLESLKLLSIIGPLNGNRLSSMSCSGGEAALIADLALTTELEFPELTEELKSRVQVTLNDYVSLSNPLDYHTFIWGDEARLTACFSAMFSGDFDLSLVIIDYPRSDRCDPRTWEPATRAIIEAKRMNGANVGVISTMAEGLPEYVVEEFRREGIVPLQGIAQALSVIERAFKLGRAWADQTQSPKVCAEQVKGSIASWDEWTSKQWLVKMGFTVPKGTLCTSPEEVAEVVRGDGEAFVIKAVSSKIVHKTEFDGVRLNIRDPEVAKVHTRELLAVSSQVLVEEMIDDGVCELIVGINRDDQFGLYMVVGFGGTLVELIEDCSIILLPADRGTVERALASLKMAPLLAGYRGGPKADKEALIQQILHLGEIARAHKECLLEIDINPLIVRPRGYGVVAVDAYIGMTEEEMK